MATINDYGFPFSSVGTDRQYGSAEWRDYFGRLISSGIIQNNANECKVKPQLTPNKTVFVDTGSIVITGAMLVVSAKVNLTIDQNTSGQARIDRIVARLNIADRKIEFAVLKGTPAVSPVAKALTRTSTIYELGLADITLANGYSTITAGIVADKRQDEGLCGFAKTMYMQSFDDENNLLKYNRTVVTVDADSNPTKIEYRRPLDSSLFLERTYSNADTNGYYQTCVEKFYLANGTTVYKTITYTFTFYLNGIIQTAERVVAI